DDTCERELATPITGTTTFSFKVRAAQTTDRLVVELSQDRVVDGLNEPGIQVRLSTDSLIQARNDTTWTDIQPYAADTVYSITVYPNVASETFTVSVNGGASSSPYHFEGYGSIPYTALNYVHVQDGADISSGSLYLDDIRLNN